MMRVSNMDEMYFVSFPKHISGKNIEELESTWEYMKKLSLEGKEVIFDFQKMDAFDYRGSKMFFKFMKNIRKRNADITFVGVKDHMIKMFNFIGFRKVFPVL